MELLNWPIDAVVRDIADGGGFGFDSYVGQIYKVSPTVRHHCDVSLELCCAGAKLRKRAPLTLYTLRRNNATIMKI